MTNKVELRQIEVSDFSSLKAFDQELEVPVVAISQPNYGPEQHSGQAPQRADQAGNVGRAEVAAAQRIASIAAMRNRL
jgi:hypothetical protein